MSRKKSKNEIYFGATEHRGQLPYPLIYLTEKGWGMAKCRIGLAPVQQNTIRTYHEFVDMIDETVSRLTFWHHRHHDNMSV